MKVQKCVWAALAAAAVCTPAMGQNLLGNGSFEDAGVGFDEFDVWSIFGNVFADNSDEVAAQDGVRCAKMFGGFFGPGIQSDTGCFQDGVAVTAGTEYRLSCYTQMLASDPMKLADFNEPLGNFGHLPLLIVDFKDAGGAGVGSAEVVAFVIDTDPTDTWVYKELTAVAPPAAVSCQVTPLLIQWGEDPGSLFWDNVVFEEVVDDACFCDCDGNDVLNVDDIDCFVAGFLGGDLETADCDDNGSLNVDDIDCYVACFLAACG